MKFANTILSMEQLVQVRAVTQIKFTENFLVRNQIIMFVAVSVKVTMKLCYCNSGTGELSIESE